MELLSPAGSLSSAYAAFKGGADAIYIGGKSFSARAGAANFTNEEIQEIVFFAHSIGRKVYVTLNTLLFQDEFYEAVEFSKFLYSIAIDGIIIQDLGLANYLHKTLPDLPLNASTQLNCHSVKQAKALISLGFKRIVLAREVNLETVKQIKALGVEVEVFGHGALCVSYSGNCLLSSFIGGRSGNRGRCAQPCRMKYELLEENKPVGDANFAISTKDLMVLEKVEELINAGVDSLKIEGRLKTEEYIYLVSKSYRHAIDAVQDHKKNSNFFKDKDNLEKTFSRKFTRGYIFNESPFKLLNTNTSSHQGQVIGKVISTFKNRVSIKLTADVHRLDGIRFNSAEQFGLAIEKMFVNRQPVEEAHRGQTIELSGIENPQRLNDLEVIKTKDYLLNKEIESELKSSIKIEVSGSFIAKVDKPLELNVFFNGISVSVKGDIAQKAVNSGTSLIRITEQLSKSGDYPYVLKNISIDVEECFIPISSINKLRNEAYQLLKDKLQTTKEVNPLEYESTFRLEQNSYLLKAIAETPEQDDILAENGIVAFTQFSKEYRNENRINLNASFDAKNELVHSFILKENTGELVASQYCNITNSYALDCYFEHGYTQCILSSELDKISISNIVSDFKDRHVFAPNVGIIIYGKLDMMIMKSCPIGTRFNNDRIHCNRCHNRKYELKDRMNAKYRLIGDSNCNIRVLQERPICLTDKLTELRNIGVSVGYLLITDENTNKIKEIIVDCWEEEALNGRSPNRGHYDGRPQ